MKLTYFGHSAFQIETNGLTLLFDPFITGNKNAERVVDPGDLNPDVILLTHAHGDHWGDTIDIARRTNPLIIANHEIVEYLGREYDYQNVHSMNTGGSWQFDWGRVKMMYARHSSSFPDGTYGGNPNGMLLYLEGKYIYNTGDTGLFSEMAWTGEDYDIDVALMPIGDCFTMGPEDAIRAIRMIKPGLTIPLHYNTFPFIEVDLVRWKRLVEEAGYRTKVLGFGETLEI